MSNVVYGTKSKGSFLTVPELAQLLHVNEKKIYKLAGEGDIPGTKITGKWIFPRHLVEDWISENSHGGAMTDRLIITGSDDRLINQVCNHTAIEHQQSALLSYSPCGTRHGLRMLDTRRADACFINWGAADPNARRHLGLLRGYKNHGSWIIVRCLQRTQGLILSRELEDTKLTAENLLSDHSLRWAQRNVESGAERLLEDLCASTDHNYQSLNFATSNNTERSAVAAVSTGDADVTCGTQATAHEFQLPFLPVADVSLDMVMTRRTYFRTITQALLNKLCDDKTQLVARQMQGYQLLSAPDVLAISG